TERGFEFTGGSAVIAPDGSVVATTGREPQDTTVFGEIDLSRVKDEATCLPAPRPELYQSLAFQRHGWNVSLMDQHFCATALPPGAEFRLVACEFDPAAHPIDEVLGELERSLASADGPCLVVLPEYSFYGPIERPEQALATAEPLDGPTVQQLTRWCA